MRPRDLKLSLNTLLKSVMASTPTPTPYRISTITFNGDLNVYIRRDVFFQNATVTENDGEEGFAWMECWMNGNQHIRGIFPKKKTQSKTKRTATATTTTGAAEGAEPAQPKNKSFDNQISMYYRFRKEYIPHVKLFKNGNIHITGLRSIEDGTFILEQTKGEIERIYKDDPTILVDDAGDITKLVVSNPIVRLINSDFQIPFKIRRKELHQLLIAPPYNTICSFQPGTYPGVKLEYYWNIRNEQKDGCCRCATPCFGKKHANGQCKKVTVAIFDSGSVLITGATSHEQVKDAYAYICDVIMTHTDYLKKNIPVLV